MRVSTLSLALALLASTVAIGCAGDRFRASRFNFFHPGTTYQQRLRASVHDPYPDQDLGPEVVGGRPRDFAPYPEAVRNRFYADQFQGR